MRITDQWPGQYRARKYPWDEWLDGQIRVLTEGEDFTSRPDNFQQPIRRMAANRGLRVRIAMVPGGEPGHRELAFQVITEEQPGVEEVL